MSYYDRLLDALIKELCHQLGQLHFVSLMERFLDDEALWAQNAFSPRKIQKLMVSNPGFTKDGRKLHIWIVWKDRHIGTVWPRILVDQNKTCLFVYCTRKSRDAGNVIFHNNLLSYSCSLFHGLQIMLFHQWKAPNNLLGRVGGTFLKEGI